MIFTEGILLMIVMQFNHELGFIAQPETVVGSMALQAAKFSFHKTKNFWYTRSIGAAIKLRDYADESTKRRIDSISIRDLSPWLYLPRHTIETDFPDLKPHQVEGILKCVHQNKTFLRYDAGLGKTAIAAITAHYLHKRFHNFKIVYICPPSLCENVTVEIQKWCASVLKNVLIFPDSKLQAEKARLAIKEFLGTSKFRLLIVDEAHRFKEFDSARTQSLLGFDDPLDFSGIHHYFNHQIFMTGTPLPNRPIELFPLLSKIAPESIDFMNRVEYGKRYCAGFQFNVQKGLAWNFQGASNVNELSEKICRKFMIKATKDVLELPPKTEEIVLINGDMSDELKRLDLELFEKLDMCVFSKPKRADDSNIIIKLALQEGRGDLPLATYRRLLGLEKAPLVLAFIESVIEKTNDNLLVFAYHKDVLEFLKKYLQRYKPCFISGETKKGDKLNEVLEFQNSNRRVLIGNYAAMGTGFNLTKADRVLFVEFDWSPAVNSQASDRVHRLGRIGPVLVQYLVFKNSVDEAIIGVNLRKQSAIKHI